MIDFFFKWQNQLMPVEKMSWFFFFLLCQAAEKIRMTEAIREHLVQSQKLQVCGAWIVSMKATNEHCDLFIFHLPSLLI